VRACWVRHKMGAWGEPDQEDHEPIRSRRSLRRCGYSWATLHAVLHLLRSTNGPTPTLSSTERECERLRTAIEELDREQTIVDRPSLPNELIHPRLGEQPCSAVVDVAS
jgi:hypothetical protein